MSDYTAIVKQDGDWWIGYVEELPGAHTQGRTLDETLANLCEAIALHLDGEDLTALGFSAAPRLLLSYETQLSEQA